MSVAKIREKFDNQINRLTERANRNHDSIAKADPDQTRWNYPKDWEGDPVMETGPQMHAEFDRTENNEDFVQALTTDEGKTGDLIVSSLQVDILAQQERAFRLRHLTRVRAAVHTAARLKMHGQDGGIFKRGHRSVLDNILKLSV